MFEPKNVTSTGHLSGFLNSFESSPWNLLIGRGHGRGPLGDHLRFLILGDGFILLLLRGR